MKCPDELDDKYYPLSTRENMEWLINDLYCYCEFLDSLIKTYRKACQRKTRELRILKEHHNALHR